MGIENEVKWNHDFGCLTYSIGIMGGGGGVSQPGHERTSREWGRDGMRWRDVGIGDGM